MKMKVLEIGPEDGFAEVPELIAPFIGEIGKGEIGRVKKDKNGKRWYGIKIRYPKMVGFWPANTDIEFFQIQIEIVNESENN